MKRFAFFCITLVLLATSAFPAPAAAAPKASIIPTFSILSVVPDVSVTIQTYNFPAGDNFDVLMNYMGTRGIAGIKVATVASGPGGSFIATFNIPDPLKGQYRIAIRLQSNTGSGYYAYNWFYNNTSAGTGGPGGGAFLIPTFAIIGVVKDTSVTIQTNNFPAGDNFDVLMNYMGTRGIAGIKVATIASGAGGTFTATFNIPDPLKGQYQIAIRLQSNTGSGYYAYNWFYNNTTGSSGGVIPGYTGYPTFFIAAVKRDVSVTIITNNLPPSDTFAVLMGPMGTRGIGGIVVATFNSGAGGTQSLTFNIPAALAGSYQIAIRIQSTSGSGYYAYNWFYNNSTY